MCMYMPNSSRITAIASGPAEQTHRLRLQVSQSRFSRALRVKQKVVLCKVLSCTLHHLCMNAGIYLPVYFRVPSPCSAVQWQTSKDLKLVSTRWANWQSWPRGFQKRPANYAQCQSSNSTTHHLPGAGHCTVTTSRLSNAAQCDSQLTGSANKSLTQSTNWCQSASTTHSIS